MNKPLFHSVFADEINSYLHCKVSSGYKATSFYLNLKHFDRFCIQHAIKEPIFTTANAVKWLQKKKAKLQPLIILGLIASVESFHRILEDECLKVNEFQTYAEAYKLVNEFMIRYNNRRMHSSLNFMSPNEFYTLHFGENLTGIEIRG